MFKRLWKISRVNTIMFYLFSLMSAATFAFDWNDGWAYPVLGFSLSMFIYFAWWAAVAGDRKWSRVRAWVDRSRGPAPTLLRLRFLLKSDDLFVVWMKFDIPVEMRVYQKGNCFVEARIPMNPDSRSTEIRLDGMFGVWNSKTYVDESSKTEVIWTLDHVPDGNTGCSNQEQECPI